MGGKRGRDKYLLRMVPQCHMRFVELIMFTTIVVIECVALTMSINLRREHLSIALKPHPLDPPLMFSVYT